MALTVKAPAPSELVPSADREWRMLIGGELISAESGATCEAVDPATDRVIGRFPTASREDVDRAVSAAKAAFPAWRKLGPARRASIVLALADAVERHGEELAVLDTVDNGTPIRTMRGDYKLAVEQMRYFAGLALQLRGDTIPVSHDRSLDYTVPEPFGVVGRIVPFNHPLMFAATKVAAPLIAGNTVVLKPAIDTSLSALRLAELAQDIVPPGALNVVTGPGSVVGERLVQHPDVRRLAFTGSVEVGQRVLQQASSVAVKTVTLELGGKNPCIVFADADPIRAVEGALRGMNFTWQGQSCGSTSRLYVHRAIFDDFVSALANAMDRLKVGDPLDLTTDVGALVSRRHFERVMDHIDAAREEPGVQLVTGGVKAGERGALLRPTLFVADKDGSRLSSEEIFGPVLVAMRFDEYDEVIARANALQYGLTASVWTSRLETALSAASDLEAGYVWINASSAHIPGAPFGGQKQSGIGREEGIEELLSYTQPKNVFVQYAAGGR